MPAQDLAAADNTVAPSVPSLSIDTIPPVASGNGTAAVASDFSATRTYSLDRDRSLSGHDGQANDATIPGYQLIAELGRGGMGVVYKARQESLKRLVALKMIRGGDHASDQDLTRFRSEAETLARMRHPNIVQIFEVGEHQGQPFFSLELLEGGNLAQRINGTPQPIDEAARIVETLARATHAAHQQGIVHRDLKPANVLLARSDEGQMHDDSGTRSQPDSSVHHSSFIAHHSLKITDFGLAKQLDIDSGQTRTGAIMGTPSYMAPEQAKGHGKEVGPAADIYALGAILYELLTGRPPFKGASAMETLLLVSTEDPVPPSSLQPKVPRDLETICLKCLRKEPQRRYASALELANELRCFQDGKPILARPIGLVERAKKWARRRPAAAALMLVSILGSLAVLIGGLYFTTELGLERNKAVAEKLAADKEWRRAEKGEAEANRLRLQAEKDKLAADRLRLQAEKDKSEADKQRTLAEAGQKEASTQLERARQALFSAQVARAAGMWRTDPVQGGKILEDEQACPGPMRDFAWHFYHRLSNPVQGIFRGGDNGQHHIAFSPDGNKLAAACDDHSVRVWNFHSKELLFEMKGHKAGVLSVVFGKDNRTLYSGCYGGVIKAWDTATGKESKTIGKLAGEVAGLALHPEGKWLAAAGRVHNLHERDSNIRYVNGEITLWNLETGEQKVFHKSNQHGFTRLAFSPDGKHLVAGCHWIYWTLWDTATGKELGRFQEGNSGWVHCVAFSPDGKFLACASADRKVHLWDFAARREIHAFTGHSADIHDVSFSRDGQMLISSADTTVRVWSMTTLREITTLRNCTPNPCGFTPDNRGVICEKGNDLHHLALFDQPEHLTLSMFQDGIHGVAFSGDGKLLAAACKDHSARLLDPATGGQIHHIGGFERPPTCLAFAADGQTVFFGAADKKDIGQIIRCDVKTGARKENWLGHPRPVTSLAAHATFPLLASGSADGTIQLWNLTSGKSSPMPAGLKEEIAALAFHPVDKRLAVQSGVDLYLWDVAEQIPRLLWKKLGGAGVQLAFTADGEFLALAKNRQLHFLDSASGEPAKAIGPAPANIASFALSKDRQTVALGLHDNTIQLCNIASNHPRATFAGHSRAVAGLAFDPQGKRLASGSLSLGAVWWIRGGEMKIWNANPGPKSQDEPVRLRFSPDGRLLLAVKPDKSLTVRDTAGNALIDFGSEKSILAARFTPESKRLVTVGKDQMLRLWDILNKKQVAATKISLSGERAPVVHFLDAGKTFAVFADKNHFWDLATLKLETRPTLSVMTNVMAESLAGGWRVEPWAGKMRIWELDFSKKPLFSPVQTASSFRFLAPLAGGKLLAVNNHLTVMICDPRGGKEYLRFDTRWLPERFALSPDGGTLATASRAPQGQGPNLAWEITFWDLKSGKECRTPITLPSADRTLALRIAPDQQLVSATSDGDKVRFWPSVKVR